MHDTAYRIGGLAMRLYCDLAAAHILEIGSQDVNGTLRDFALPSTSYTGLDIEARPGVNRVMTPGKSFPVDDEAFDLVMATSVFEHDPAFWMTFIEMCRKAKPGGYIYINAPSNGLFHQYPQDHWRFYPDCGLALVDWARTQGLEVCLVEAFTAEREGDIWNDFVAVFRKGALGEGLPAQLISDELPCTNVRTWRSADLDRRRDETEDMQLMKRMGDRAQHLEGEVQAMQQQGERRLAEMTQVSDEREALARAVEAARQDLLEAQNRLSSLESTLAQRQEEITQAWAELAEQRNVGQALQQSLDESIARTEETERKLEETNTWVFHLSGERSKFETLTSMLEGKLQKAEASLQASKAALEREKEATAFRLGEARAAVARIEAEMRKALLQSRAEKETTERRLNERFREIATLTNLLAEREALTKKSAAQVDWLQTASATILNGSSTRKGWFLGLLPAFVRYGRQKKLLAQKGVFDGNAYLAAHPDVANEGMDPLHHYIRHGMKEGRRIR